MKAVSGWSLRCYAQPLEPSLDPAPQAAFADVANLPDESFGADAAIDLFTVPTATFRVLFVFVVLSHERRRVVHIEVTNTPTQE